MSVSETESPPNAPVRAMSPLVVVPYVPEWLRNETIDALSASGVDHHFCALEAGDPYAYARNFERWWMTAGDLMVIEHDMVPAPGQIAEMLSCPEHWCSANYHVGDGRTTTGLGICKISWQVKVRWPYGGMNISHDPRDTRRYVDWIGLNESVDRHLSRLGYRQHIHFPNPVHLHYDEAPDAS